MSQFKVLIVTIPERGHINPLIGIVQCLQKMNLDIAFFSQGDISDQLNKANIKCKCYTPKQNFDIPNDLIAHGADFSKKIKDKEWMQRWIKTLLIDSVPFLVKELGDVVNVFEPDVIVSDPMVYATAIVAEKVDIPWAGISNSLNPLTPKSWKSDLTETLHKYKNERLTLFSSIQRNIKFRVADLISPWLNTVFTSEDYISRGLSNNDFSFYAGTPFPLKGNRGDEPPFPFDQINTTKKIVYMSLGSMVFYHPILFTTIAEAVEKLNVQLILSVGDLYYEDFSEKFPKDSIVLPYVPQLEILKKVDVMISHGGANSILECLSHGVPMALLPICNDQFFQAKFLEIAKTGIVLDTNKPDIDVYRSSLIQLLQEDNIYRKNAESIRKSLYQYEGPQKVADLIHQLLEKRQPLKPLVD
ncbi:glycosyltransferase [Aquimarina megaterium]|uniref:glycosyltransferase n=1 Tax=Aquimarina megaterium TaxID=1443666 RepID=UPI00046EC682|nr:glycosyltransferase [Aquimarina megaterium]